MVRQSAHDSLLLFLVTTALSCIISHILVEHHKIIIIPLPYSVPPYGDPDRILQTCLVLEKLE